MAHKPDVSNSEQSQRAPEVRIVLIGGRRLTRTPSGKSSAGNIILGQRVFDTSRRTAQSEVRQQEILSRQVTVVDTPGWRWFCPLEDTPILDQIEIQNSVHLCPPGPHVFLLVVPVKLHLSQEIKSSLKEHLELFSSDLWSHTMVLFTSPDPCSEQQVESKIRRNPPLQWILQQCGNRKHVLNIRNMEDRAQVKMLLEKIEGMVAGNRDRLYSVDRADGEALREQMNLLAEKASKRLDQVQKQRKKLRALIEGGAVPPEHLRLVLVGGSFGGRSSAGNIILGKKTFDVRKGGRKTLCEVSHSVVAGRRLTVVDSPGWFYINTLQDTSEMDKLEIESSMSLCPPGPHAVLLVIDLVSPIHQSYLKSVQEHMSLFTEEIWKHTMVLFTYIDWLGVKTVEERIESDEGLQWIVNKCENRYHVLNNLDQIDKTQVKELLEKIDEMWAGNENPYYEVDQSRAKLIEDKKDAEDKKARRMKKVTERQTRVMKELMGGQKQKLTDIRIVLVGPKCSGKSLTGNFILMKKMFVININLNYLNKDFQDQRRTSTCVKHEGDFDGVKVRVVETPGWFRDTTPPDWIKEEVLHSVSMCSPGPHVFLLVVPVLRSFTEKDLKALVEVFRPFPERVWRHCMVLFTWRDWLSERPVEDYISREGRSIQELLDMCGNRYHLLSPFGDPALVKELFQRIIDMVTRNKGCFATEDKQMTFQFLPWQSKQRTLNEEWNRREEKLLERVMKALAKEPEEPTVPSVEVARSISYRPDMSGDAASDFGNISEFRNQRSHDYVSEWLRTRVSQSEISSGIGSISSSASYVENMDEDALMAGDKPDPHMSVLLDTGELKQTLLLDQSNTETKKPEEPN